MGTLLSLTAAQVTTLAALGVLAKIGGIGAGLLLARNRSRGKRQSDQEKITLEMLTNIEPDDCYKRVICSASTGKVNNEKMMGVLKLMSEDLTIMRAPIQAGFEVCGGSSLRRVEEECCQMLAPLQVLF